MVVVAKDYKGLVQGRIGTVLDTGRGGKVSFDGNQFFGININLELAEPPTTAFAMNVRRLRELWREIGIMKFLLEDHTDLYDDFTRRRSFPYMVMFRSCCKPREWDYDVDPDVNPEKYDNINEDCSCLDCIFKQVIKKYKGLYALREENAALRRELQDRQNFITAVRSMTRERQSIIRCNGEAEKKPEEEEEDKWVEQLGDIVYETGRLSYYFQIHDEGTGVHTRLETMMQHLTWKDHLRCWSVYDDLMADLEKEFANMHAMQEENRVLRLELKNIYTFIAAVQVMAERSRLHD